MLKCLQAGRAIAALAVVAYHLSGAFGDSRYGGRPVGWFFTQYGNLGVDFFFVLSGFIILNAHAKDIGRPDRWGVYLWKRFARVYPIYWIYLAVFCLLLVLGFGQVTHTPRDIAAWITAFSLVRFSPDAAPLQVAWTLFHEVAFYAIFSILIIQRRLGIAVLAIWAMACAALYHFNGVGGSSAFKVYTSAYNLEFFFGMGAYRIYRSGRYHEALIIAGIAVLVGAGALAYVAGRVEHLVFGVGFASLIAGMTIAEVRARLLSPRILVALGGASYSLYLVHVPVIGLLLKAAIVTHLPAILPVAVLWWLVYFATAAFAYLAWLALEKPLQARMRFGPFASTVKRPA